MVSQLKDKSICVLGMGISSRGVIKELKKQGFSYEIYTNFEDININKFDIIVKSPGIPYYNKIIKLAKKSNIMVITDIELAYLLYPDKEYIGITGTNGKTTTTKLVYEMMKKKYNIGIGGNIGISVFDCIDKDIILLELSSFQLEGIIDFKPKVGVILNITSNHLDYHIDFEKYKLAKLNIMKNMDDQCFFIYNGILNVNNEAINLSYNSTETAYIEDNSLYYNDEYIIDIDKILLKGNHNLENIMAAITIAKIYHISNEIIRNVLQNFNSLEHRIELVYKGELTIYNDSKSTNPISTLVALKAMDMKVVLIMGGYDRFENFEIIDKVIEKIDRVYVYGETRKKLYDYFIIRGISVYRLKKLKSVIKHYRKNYILNETVLFSPGCASWDCFKNYQERGKYFKEQMKKLTLTLS